MLTFGIVALASVQAAGSAPTPVYRFYQELFGLSPGALALIFGLYPLGLLAALLTVGSLSDHIGRRPCMAASLLLSAISMAALALAVSAPQLMAARLVQGYGTGAAASCLGAAILDTSSARGPVINTITAFIGTTIGAFGCSALVVFAPWPTRLVYVIALVVFVVLAAAVYQLPETVSRSPGAWRALRPHVALPNHVRHAFLVMTPVNVAGWALGSFYLSLGPAMVRAQTGLQSPLVGGAVVAALTLSGAAAMVAWRSEPGKRVLRRSALILAAGVSLTMVGIFEKSLTMLVLATIIAGSGFGGAVFGAARTLLPLAAPHERAGVLSAFYIESYTAFSLPAIAAGFVSTRFGVAATTYVYGAVLIALALVSFGLTRRSPP